MGFLDGFRRRKGSGVKRLEGLAYEALFFEAAGGSAGRPLLLFLHGKGERGRDLEQVRAHGPPHLFPSFGLGRFSVLAPQCPDEEVWDAARLQALVQAASSRFSTDPKRLYLTGISMGGTGAWELACEVPELFAAAVIICARIRGAGAEKLKALPLWLFHSVNDQAVPIENGDAQFDALRAQNANFTYTRYRDLTHSETWTRAYGSPLVFEWLLQHSK